MRSRLDVVKEQWDAFVASGEVDLESLDEDVVVTDHDIPDATPYHGINGYVRWLENWGDAWESWSAEPEEFIEVADRVVVVLRVRARGKGSGVEVDRQDAIVYELEGDKQRRIDYFNNKADAIDFARSATPASARASSRP